MLELTCSTCGKRVLGDDSVAGQLAACPVCNTAMLVPQSESSANAVATPEHAHHAKISASTPPNDSSLHEGPPSTRAMTGRALTFHWLRALVFISVIILSLTMCGLFLNWREKVDIADKQTQSINNLKQIGLAMQSFHDGNKRLPFNGIAAGKKSKAAGSSITYYGNATTDCASSGSWLFQILPYCDSLRPSPFRLTGNANSDEIPPLFQNFGVQVLMCAGRARQSFIIDAGPWSDYHINIILNSSHDSERVDAPDVKRTLLGITDGTSNTIFAGHGYMNRDAYRETTSQGNFSSVIWIGGTEGTARALGVPLSQNLEPGVGPATRLMRDDWQNTTGITSATTPQPWGGPFADGALFLMCDGAVRLIPYHTPQATSRNLNFGALLTPSNADGGINAGLPD